MRKIILFLFIFSLFFFSCNQSIIAGKSLSTASSSTTIIQISSNSMFKQAANTYSWLGNGTYASPIIISNLNSFIPLSLIIENTNLSFIIQNINISLNNNFFVSLTNLSNGIISKNYLHGGSQYSVFNIEKCSNLTITDNIFSFNGYYTVGFDDSANITFSRNIIKNQIYGIYTNYAINQNFTIAGNYFETEKGIAFLMHGSIINNVFSKIGLGQMFIDYSNQQNFNNIYANNTINGKLIYIVYNQSNLELPGNLGEILIFNSHNITIHNQNITNDYTGIEIYHSNNITIRNSRFSSINELYTFYNSTNIILKDNTIYNSTFKWEYCKNNIIENNTLIESGIAVDYSNSMQILNNEIINSNIGSINLYIVSNIDIINNAIKNCSEIDLLYVNYTIIENNTISYSSGSGLYLWGLGYSVIQSNSIYMNKFDGVDLYSAYSSNSADNNQILKNSIYKNGKDGINIDSNNEVIRYNKIFDNYANGISILIGSQNNTITNNNIYSNSGSGIYVVSYSDSPNSVYKDNIIKNNNIYNNGADIKRQENNVILIVSLVVVFLTIILIYRKMKMKMDNRLDIDRTLCKFCGQKSADDSLYCSNCGIAFFTKD